MSAASDFELRLRIDKRYVHRGKRLKGVLEQGKIGTA
jgi:hypothetical protein